ncbi:hypothetical protein ACFL7M_15295 [Thermodesulfobacteriota bacterium]
MTYGVGELCLVVVPHPMGMISSPEIREKADTAFPEVLKVLTSWNPQTELPPEKPSYPAETFTFKGTIEEINRLFFLKGWSLGLPIIPPTPESVAEMLKGTSRDPDEILGLIPPRFGVLTVEMIAVHAVMAGCKPSYMPILIAAFEALLDPGSNWRGISTTTGTTSALVIVNGPIVKEIGIAYGQGSAGKMHHANGSIGYAVNLVVTLIGGSKPPSPDMSTLGSPADFVCWIFGENEDAIPEGWEPYHVDRGFNRNDSVVTLAGVFPPVDNIDHWSQTPEEHINWWAHLVTPLLSVGGPCIPNELEIPHIFAMGPEHAQLVAGAGWSKDRFKKAFWEKARIPLSVWPKNSPNKIILEGKLGVKLTPETLIPMTLKPEYFHIVIAGGTGKHSHFFAPQASLPISKVVKK